MSECEYLNGKGRLLLTNIAVAAIQNCLVTTLSLADASKSLYDAQSQLPSLLVFLHSDVLNVSDTAETTQELALYEHGSNSNNLVGRFVDNDKGVVGVCGCTH